MLRVNRFAAAMDMMAAGTRAPMPMAAKATPVNQSGNMFSKSWGIASCPFCTFTPAAIAMKPSSASRPSISEYSGRMVALRRITPRLRLERGAGDPPGAAAGGVGGDRVRIQEEPQRRAEGERGVAPLLFVTAGQGALGRA